MTFVRLRITASLALDVADPWALFRCRDRFFEAFRRQGACRSGDRCLTCSDAPECPVPYLFSQELSVDAAGAKRHQKPPLPFAFTFPLLPLLPNKGAKFCFELTLVGAAVHYLARFVTVLPFLLDDGSQRGEGLTLEKIVSIGYFGEEQPLAWDAGAGVVTTPPILLTLTELLASQGWGGECLGLEFVTPVKLMRDGKAVRAFAASVFLRSLMRRVSSLAFHYCEAELHADYKWLAVQSATLGERCETMRWGAWGGTGRDEKLSGLLGTAVLKGGYEEFLPFLLAGEFLNVGKGASFGLGQYRLRDCPR